MTDPRDVLRSFRSPDFRDLTRKALDQGWSVYQRPGGHIDVVNPTNGAVVQLSMTAHTGGPVLKPKRHEFEKAGLDLSRAAARRASRRQAVMEVPMPEPINDPVLDELPVFVSERVPEAVTGRYTLLEQETIEIEGHTVVIAQRADGKWFAKTPDPSRKSGRKQWLDEKGRDALLRKITRDLAPVAEPEAYRFHATPTVEFPIAEALDALERVVAPALVALEAAGKTDAADLLRAELERTPVEDELLRLWRQRGDDGRLTS